MTALALSGDWAMFTKRDALHVRDIERAFAGSSAPFSARATSYALETSDIEGAAPRARTRGAAGGAPLSRSLTTADIAGARPRGPARPSGRDPLEPNYALPSAQQARWGPAEFRGIYAMNGRGLDGGSAHARAQVREGNYTVDGPRALYPGAPRSAPERIDGARPFARAHAADARRAGPPRDALFAADILHPRLFQSARDAPGRSPAEHAGALSDAARALRWGVPRDPPRDPVDPEYNYDCAGPDAVGPISGARHIQPYTLERTILASGPRAGRPPPPRVEGSGADTRSALRRGRATRRGILEIDDIEVRDQQRLLPSAAVDMPLILTALTPTSPSDRRGARRAAAGRASCSTAGPTMRR